MVWCNRSKVVGGGIDSSLKPARISKSFFSVLALFSLLIVSLFALSNAHSTAFADEIISDKVSLNSATITTNITGYTSGVAVKLDSDSYEVGDSVVLSWRGAAVGNDLVIPTSIKYSGSATTIGVQTIVPIDQIQTANTAYERYMDQRYTMTTYDSLKSFATSTHYIEVGNCAGDGTVRVEFARVCPVYRMYNKITSEHLFTTDKTEYDGFQKKLDGRTEFWIGEGIDWLAPYSSSAVVHRLYNPALGAMFRSSHYYTSDKAEINKLVKKYGWKDDGATKQFYSGGSTPIYTCYNEALGSAHHYTSSKSEWSGLKKHGWDLEESKNVKNKAYTGVFSGIMGTSWTFSSNYYTVCHRLVNNNGNETYVHQVIAGKAGSMTAAKILNFYGYYSKDLNIEQKEIDSYNSTEITIWYYEIGSPNSFAVFSKDDGSLDFYNRATSVPTVGSKFNGKTVSYVFIDIESKWKNWSWGSSSLYPAYFDRPESETELNLKRTDVLTVDFVDKITLYVVADMFAGCVNLTEVKNLNNLDTSNVEYYNGMFRGCSKLKSLDVSNFNLSKAKSLGDKSVGGSGGSKGISGMFYGCNALEELDVSKWDVSGVESMANVFAYCLSLKSLDLSSWDVSSVTDMQMMFKNCYCLRTIGQIQGWNTSSVNDMWFMFYYCNYLTADCSPWDVSNVERHDGFNSLSSGVIPPNWVN